MADQTETIPPCDNETEELCQRMLELKHYSVQEATAHCQKPLNVPDAKWILKGIVSSYISPLQIALIRY